MTIAAISPGKIILSGEHSVVYGAPAMVAAIARYTTVSFFPIHHSKSLRTALKGIAMGRNFPLDALGALREKLDSRFDAFRKGLLPAKNILQRPDDLVLYTLAQLAKHLPVPGRTSTRGLPMPGHLKTNSDIPLGAGMGSSAAVIAATIVLYEKLLNKPLSLEERFSRIRFCERLQHGNGSAIDATAVTYGGVQRLENQQFSRVNANLSGWFWALSGIPQSSTGECVYQVHERFAKKNSLWQQFSDCTHAIESAIFHHNSPIDAIKENDQLLRSIGVVPLQTQKFIDDIAKIGGAAKISGAGSIRGNNGGIVIFWHPESEVVSQMMQKQYPSFRWEKLEVASQGATLVEN